MKFSFESHDEDDELYLPIPAFRYEELIECESRWESLRRTLVDAYHHDDFVQYKNGYISYKPIDVLRMMELYEIADRLEGERNAAEDQKSED